MYCSDEREVALNIINILSFAFKMVYTVLETNLKSLHICALAFLHLSTAFIITTLVLIIMPFLLFFFVFIDMVAMQ